MEVQKTYHGKMAQKDLTAHHQACENYTKKAENMCYIKSFIIVSEVTISLYSVEDCLSTSCTVPLKNLRHKNPLRKWGEKYTKRA